MPHISIQTFISYLRSVHLQKNKSIFKVDELPVNKFAASLGLPGAPKIKFLNKKQKDSRKELLVDSNNPSENKGDHTASQSEDDHSSDDNEASDDSVRASLALTCCSQIYWVYSACQSPD